MGRRFKWGEGWEDTIEGGVKRKTTLRMLEKAM